MSLTEFGQRLQIIGIQRGMTLKEMADGIGVTSSHLSALEHGKRKISEQRIRSISKSLGLTNDESARLRASAYRSNGEVRISLAGLTLNTEDLVVAFASGYERLGFRDQQEIMKMLERAVEGKSC